MKGKEWAEILGEIPNVMEQAIKLENRIAPQLAKINKHRDEIDPELLKQFDEQMNNLTQAKINLKNAYTNNK